jgi:hypothetical protein
MRNLTLTAIALLLTAPALFAQNTTDLDAFEVAMKPGTVLTYDVNANNKRYQFIVTLKKLGDEIAFDWKMTDPINKTGNVVMSPEAVAKADALVNSFSGGESKLSKETSVFISRKIINDVSTTTMANIKLNGAGDTATVMSNTISEFNFNLNGNMVAVPGWELQGGGDTKYTVDVLESNKFPIIFRMDLGWTIQLAEIKTM